MLNDLPEKFRYISLKSILRLKRFDLYETFKKYKLTELFNNSVINQEILPALTFSIVDWYNLIPSVMKQEYINKWIIYKEILIEMLNYGHLKDSIGWNQVYMKYMVEMWAKAPIPSNGVKTKRKMRLEMYQPMVTIFGKHANVTQCPYCTSSVDCMASKNEHFNGACGPEKEGFYCNLNAGIHLCLRHGQMLMCDYRDMESGRLSLRLADGREVVNLEIVKASEKAEDNICIGNIPLHVEENTHWSMPSLKTMEKLTVVEDNTLRDQIIRERKASNPLYVWGSTLPNVKE